MGRRDFNCTDAAIACEYFLVMSLSELPEVSAPAFLVKQSDDTQHKGLDV